MICKHSLLILMLTRRRSKMAYTTTSILRNCLFSANQIANIICLILDQILFSRGRGQTFLVSNGETWEFLMLRGERAVFWEISGRSDMVWCSYIQFESIVSPSTPPVPKRVFSSLWQGRSVVLDIVFWWAWWSFHGRVSQLWNGLKKKNILTLGAVPIFGAPWLGFRNKSAVMGSSRNMKCSMWSYFGLIGFKHYLTSFPNP